MRKLNFFVCFLFFAHHSIGQDINLTKLLSLSKMSLSQASNLATKDGWEYKQSITEGGEGIMWGQYDSYRIQSVLMYRTYNSPLASNDKDKILIFLGTYSSTYNKSFVSQLESLGYTNEDVKVRTDGLEKHFLNKDLDSHVVIREMKGENGIQYGYFIATENGFLVWYGSELFGN
jgi:hypothetical protein